MRYAQEGGLAPREQEKRERLRLEAAERFVRGEKTEAIARELRVTARSVRRWRRAWEHGGADALRSKGPVSAERLSPAQWERLERELGRGPLAHGFGDEFQGWTLKRVKLLIGRMFHIGYTVQGLWKLLRRHGWYAQVPLRRAIERDEEAIEVWKAEVWPEVKDGGGPGRPHLLRGRGGPGAEATEGTHLGAARSLAGGAGARPQPRAGQHRRSGLLPGRASLPLLLHPAHLARPSRRAEGVLLAPVP
jgi:putative transposase